MCRRALALMNATPEMLTPKTPGPTIDKKPINSN